MNIWLVVWTVYVSFIPLGRPINSVNKWEVFTSSRAAYEAVNDPNREKIPVDAKVVGPIDISQYNPPHKSFDELADDAARETDKQLDYMYEPGSVSYLQALISDYEKISANIDVGQGARNIINRKIRDLRVAIMQAKSKVLREGAQ